jgi:hypothetical protein
MVFAIVICLSRTCSRWYCCIFKYIIQFQSIDVVFVVGSGILFYELIVGIEVFCQLSRLFTHSSSKDIIRICWDSSSWVWGLDESVFVVIGIASGSIACEVSIVIVYIVCCSSTTRCLGILIESVWWVGSSRSSYMCWCCSVSRGIVCKAFKRCSSTSIILTLPLETHSNNIKYN